MKLAEDRMHGAFGRSAGHCLRYFTAILALVIGGVGAPAECAKQRIQKIETTNAILSFKADSGDLVGVQWKTPRIDIIGDGRLGENFRILLPQPDYEANYFNSHDQVVRRIDRTENGVVLMYGPLKNAREEVDIKVAYEIRDNGTQLLFSIQVDNATDRKLAEVLYGIVGGQRGIGERLETESFIPAQPYGNLAPRMFNQFKDSQWHWGAPVNSAGYTYPGMSMGWIDIYNTKKDIGYYYANHDPETRLTALYTEMSPYVKRLRPIDNWPSKDELPSSEPIGLTMGWVNFPYAGKGRFRAGPIALDVHRGDWHTAAKIYRAWFDQHFQVVRPLNWLRKEMAWYSLNLMAPDDKFTYRFADLPKLAADAKRYGVTTFQIFGWATGGQDRGRPNYSPDSRLGSRDEFRKALAGIRALGVHPLLYVNIQHVDSSTDAFRKRYSRFALQGRFAPDLEHWTFGYNTIGPHIITTAGRQQVLVSPSHSEYREELVRKYLDIIHDGAEGLQIDAALGADILLDFNPNLSTSPDKSIVNGYVATFEEFLRRARKINPDVALAFQDGFDRWFPYNDAWYHAIFDKDVVMATRYAFPEFNFVDDVTDPGDYDPLNNAMRYGVVWGISPRGATASMDEELTRPLSQYLSELIRIRKQYADLLFYGRFNDILDAKVVGDKENIRYSVFTPTSAEKPQRACVIVNFGDREESVDVFRVGQGGQEVVISAPYERDRNAVLPAKVTLPPHRVAVVVRR